MWFLCLNIIAELPYIRAVRCDFAHDAWLQAGTGVIFGFYVVSSEKICSSKNVNLKMESISKSTFSFWGWPFLFQTQVCWVWGGVSCSCSICALEWEWPSYRWHLHNRMTDFWVYVFICYVGQFHFRMGLAYSCECGQVMGWGAWQGRILYFFLPELAESLSIIYRAVDSIPWRLLFSVFWWLVMSTKKWNLSTQG